MSGVEPPGFSFALPRVVYTPCPYDERTPAMDDDPGVLARIRVLRASSYRCQARDSMGYLCGAPAKDVSPLSIEGLALCRFHIERPIANGVSSRRPKARR